jgi:hypothetical protein
MRLAVEVSTWEFMSQFRSWDLGSFWLFGLEMLNMYKGREDEKKAKWSALK